MGAPSRRPQAWTGWWVQHYEFGIYPHGPSLDLIFIIVHATDSDILGHPPTGFDPNSSFRTNATLGHHSIRTIAHPRPCFILAGFPISLAYGSGCRLKTRRIAHCKEIGARREQMYPPSLVGTVTANSSQSELERSIRFRPT